MNKRIIIVTGGCQGLGKEIAKTLSADEKNAVIIVSENKESLQKTGTELGIPFLYCDVTKPEIIKTVVDEVISQFGKIDILINNAGVIIEGELDTNDPIKIGNVFNVNTLGTIYFSRQVLPTMKANKSGIILNVISYSGLNARPKRSVYNASKWAITGFTESLRMEVAPYGISVLGLYPSLIKTNLFKNAGISTDLANGLEPADIAKVVETMLSFKDLQMSQVVVRDIGYEF